MAFLTARQLKLYLSGVGLVTLLALLVTVLIMLLGGRTDSPDEGARDEGSRGGEASAEEVDIFSSEERIVSQIEVPEEYKAVFEARWKPFRPVYDSWSKEQIEPFWIDPKKIIEEQLKKESSKAVNSFLEELP
ncbi:MAG: hypothetical protein R6V67_05690 [Spirochaetia bacterium]